MKQEYHDGRFVTETLIALTLVVKAVVQCVGEGKMLLTSNETRLARWSILPFVLLAQNTKSVAVSRNELCCVAYCKRRLLQKIWRVQLLPIGNEQYSSLKLMTKGEVSASRRICGSWMDGSVLSKVNEA